MLGRKYDDTTGSDSALELRRFNEENLLVHFCGSLLLVTTDSLDFSTEQPVLELPMAHSFMTQLPSHQHGPAMGASSAYSAFAHARGDHTVVYGQEHATFCRERTHQAVAELSCWGLANSGANIYVTIKLDLSSQAYLVIRKLTYIP